MKIPHWASGEDKNEKGGGIFRQPKEGYSKIILLKHEKNIGTYFHQFWFG